MNLDALLAANPNPKLLHITREVVNLPGPERLFQFSPSQVDTYRDCPRKWAFDKIDRVPRVQNEAAKLGTEVHDLREKWLRDGVMPDGDDYASLCARAGIEQLPMPGTASIEGEIVMHVELNGKKAFWLGYKDFGIDDQGAAGYYPPERSDWPSVEGIPLVGDHKTTGSASYIKTPEFLVHEDVQGAMYSWDAFVKNPQADELDLFWAYIVKNKKPKPVPVRARAKRSQIEATYLRVLDDAGQMMSIFDTPGVKANDVEPNPKACDKYGGCPHRRAGRCHLTMDQKLGALKMSSGDLEAKLLADLGGNAPAVETNNLPGASTPAPTPTNGNGDNSVGLAGLQAAMSEGIVIDMPAQPAEPATPPPTAAPATQPGALASMLGGGEPTAPAQPQTVADAAKSLSEAEKVSQAAQPPPPVVPPDAPPADLDAEPPKDKPKKMTAAVKKRREAIATEVFSALVVAGQDNEHAAAAAVQSADALIAALDA